MFSNKGMTHLRAKIQTHLFFKLPAPPHRPYIFGFLIEETEQVNQ